MYIERRPGGFYDISFFFFISCPNQDRVRLFNLMRLFLLRLCFVVALFAWRNLCPNGQDRRRRFHAERRRFLLAYRLIHTDRYGLGYHPLYLRNVQLLFGFDPLCNPLVLIAALKIDRAVCILDGQTDNVLLLDRKIECIYPRRGFDVCFPHRNIPGKIDLISGPGSHVHLLITRGCAEIEGMVFFFISGFEGDQALKRVCRDLEPLMA